jgi:uncharacterized membrane protein
MNFSDTVEFIGKTLDVIGIGVIFIGMIVALGFYLARLAKRAGAPVAYRHGRRDMGRAILLGLEFLVAGDIIRTVATSPTFTNVGILGLIVLIRTFLSVALQVEVEGRWPWQEEFSAPETERAS